jgi:hypothetical protein
MGLKLRDSTSSDKENDPEREPNINLKRVETESSHEEHVSDSSSTRSSIVPI